MKAGPPTHVRFEIAGKILEVIDAEAQAVYIRVPKGRVHRTLEPEPDVFVDVDGDNHLLGLEVLRPVGHVEIMHRLAEKYREPALDLFDAGKVNRLFASSTG